MVGGVLKLIPPLTYYMLHNTIKKYYVAFVFLHLQLLQRQPIIILSEKSSVDKFQTKSLIILVIIILGAEVFVTIAWSVFLEETGKVFQIFLLVSFKVAAHNDNAPIGDTADTTTVFPETDV